MLLVFEQSTQVSITQAIHPYMWVNTKYMGDRFDLGKESHYLQYLDANNLYGWVISQHLLTGEFKKVSNPDKLKGNISELPKGPEKGYPLEVDVSYRHDLHDLHNDLPFMCEKMKIHSVQKLVPNLYDKKKLVIRITALDQMLKYGLILKQIL